MSEATGAATGAPTEPVEDELAATPASPASRGIMAAVGQTAAMKVMVMGVSGILGILTSRMIITHFGTDAYGQYGLLTSITALLPFADLGIAAVVINTIAGSTDPRSDQTVRRTITTALRILIASASIITAVSVVITVLGGWPTLLGNGLLAGSGSLAALLSMIAFGITLPLTVGQRILVGLQRSSTQVASQAVVAPFILLCVSTSVALSLPIGSYLAVVSYLGNGLISVVCLVVSARLLKPQLGRAVRDVPRLRSAPGVPVMATTWPMLLQMMALPVAMQTDRLLISHLTVGTELAQYNLASQLFGIVLQTVATASVALWPIYAKARASGTIMSPARPTLYFMLGGLTLGSTLALLSPWVAAFVSDGKIHLDGWLVWGFVSFIAVQVSKYPVGMYMTDAKGLTFQVLPILIMIPINLSLSWWLIGVIGAGGTIIGSTISVFLCQVVPNVLYVRRDLARRRGEAAAATTE